MVQRQRIRVVYVAYWGLLEPLGRSLVAPAAEGLGDKGAEVVLVTFEKAHDLADRVSVEEMRLRMARAGVQWHPRVYHKRPRMLAKALDVATGVASCVRLVLRERSMLIHGRTFIGGLIGCLTAKLTRRPWVYHGEGFWPEQQVEGGVWAPGSGAFRATRAIDRWLHSQASGIILLAQRAVPTVERIPGVAKRRPAVVVVPSCVDLGRFPRPGAKPSGPVRLVYVGSLGGRYLVEPLVRFLQAALEMDSGASLRVYSHSDTGALRLLLESAGLPPGSWHVGFAPNAEVPRLVAESHVGLMFLVSGPGSHSCSPTKIGEYWAAGLPVVCTEGLGDVDSIVRDRSVGVVMRSLAPESIRSAAEEALRLAREPGIAERCRAAADVHYALDPHVLTQLELYRRICHPQGPVATDADGRSAGL